MRFDAAIRRGLRGGAPLAALLLAAAASAQYEVPDELEQQNVPQPMQEDEAGPAVNAPGAEPGLPGPKPNFADAPRQYTVQQGDTLWDITQRFLGNPWYWPKVWSSNPEIENPNWIYPGNVIRFYGGGEALPARIGTPEEIAGGPGAPAPDDGQVVSQTGKLSYTPPNVEHVLDQGFVTSQELDSSGEIVGAWEEKMLLTSYDRVYVDFKNGARPAVGERYIVFRTGDQVFHPKTHQPVGWMTEIVGTARIVEDPGSGVEVAVIGESLDAAQRGDRLMPWNADFAKTVTQRQNQVELEGVVLGSLRGRLVAVGEHHYIFIDKGRRDGVEVGNTFEVLRRGDPLAFEPKEGSEDRLPWEHIGTALVVEVRDEVSTALVTNSVREIGVGDRVVMRVGGAARAQR